MQQQTNYDRPRLLPVSRFAALSIYALVTVTLSVIGPGLAKAQSSSETCFPGSDEAHAYWEVQDLYHHERASEVFFALTSHSSDGRFRASYIASFGFDDPSRVRIHAADCSGVSQLVWPAVSRDGRILAYQRKHTRVRHYRPTDTKVVQSVRAILVKDRATGTVRKFTGRPDRLTYAPFFGADSASLFFLEQNLLSVAIRRIDLNDHSVTDVFPRNAESPQARSVHNRITKIAHIYRPVLLDGSSFLFVGRKPDPLDIIYEAPFAQRVEEVGRLTSAPFLYTINTDTGRVRLSEINNYLNYADGMLTRRDGIEEVYSTSNGIYLLMIVGNEPFGFSLFRVEKGSLERVFRRLPLGGEFVVSADAVHFLVASSPPPRANASPAELRTRVSLYSIETGEERPIDFSAARFERSEEPAAQ